MPPGIHTLRVSYLGYKSKRIQVTVKSNTITQVDLLLSPASVELEELVVLGAKGARPTETDLGLEKISIREIDMLPSGAERDIFRILQTIPGVSTTGDVSSKYYVRGGGGDQNEVLVNGAVLYNPYHALGIFSVVDPEMISVLEFYKGGFASNFGGRLSSVLNIITRDGNKNNYNFTAQASLLTAKMALEGPIPFGSFIFTGRISYYSDILKEYMNDKIVPVNFYDLSFKLNYSNPNWDKNGKFVLHSFMSRDEINNNDPLKQDYFVDNKIIGINWHKVWGSPLYSDFNIYYSGFNGELYPNLTESKPRRNNLTDITSYFNFNYIYQNNDELQFGVQTKFLSTELSLETLLGNRLSSDASGLDLSVYGNYKFYRWETLGLDLGIRAKLMGLSDKRPFLLEPRISINYSPSARISFKAAIGRYSQEIISLSDENELISIFEPWIIIPEEVAAPQATHFILGFKYNLSDFLTLEFEGYYKALINLIDINENKFSENNRDYLNRNGKAYGLESELKYQTNNFYFKTGYSLSWVLIKKDASYYFPRYDIRHSLNFLIGVVLGKEWYVNLNWSYRSGMPFTPMAGFYDRLSIEESRPWYVFDYFLPATHWGARNSYRLPVYHKLDLSLSKNLEIFAMSTEIEASIINVYDRMNIYYFDTRTGERVNMLPFLPTLSIKIKI